MKLHHASRTSMVKLLKLFLLACSLPLSACAYFANQPLDVLYYTGESTSHTNLFVFVRGLGGSHRSFAEAGMVEATWQHDIDFDMVAPNSHFAYYSERSLIERLRQDVILPARNNGYENIWLVGPSMGGLGSLLYIREHPGEIAGVYLINPFLGYDNIINEIKAQGALQSWQPGEYSPDKDWQRMLWHYLKDEVAQQKTPPVYLGFGNDDTYVEAQQLLASVLPADHIIRVKGGHDYKTFKDLWLQFLRRDINLTH